MKIGHIELFVSDLQKSLAFYRDKMGLEVTALQGEHFAWLKIGESEILLRSDYSPRLRKSADYQTSGNGICFYTKELQAKMKELKSRGLEFSGDDGTPDCPTFHDPDGHWFQLVNPGKHQ
ncbi:MAG TPA: VOC family protein [bacterium]|jgi:catechol 2,3-dioxygenase-like lactoylglutathione lyase family enzyme